MASTTQATVALWTGRKTARAARIVLPSPATWTVVLVATLSVLAVATVPWLAFVVIPWMLIVLAFWRINFPDGYAFHVTGRARGTARSLIIYRTRWAKGLRKSGVYTGNSPAPILLRTNSTPVYDRLTVRMVAGQRIEDFAEETDRLTQTFGALACRVHQVPTKPRQLEMTFLTTDPLVTELGPYPPDPDWQQGLPIAIHEDGTPWKLKLIGSHVLLVGATGAGKSSVIWAIIDQLIPARLDKTVNLWVLDPKGGMELTAGQQWYNTFVYGTHPNTYAATLEAAVALMKDRQAELRGVTRQHQPTTAQPLIVIIIDELAALTSWAPTETRARIHQALGLLLSQGRAVGISVIGAVQDPRKETIPHRGLFTTRICLRVNEADEVRMALGAGAWQRGAKAEQIPKQLPGVGYVTIDGDPDPYRVRVAHVTDTMISQFTAPPPQADQAGTDAVPEPTGIFIA
jgi:S-DNA-T family DNA segregation ATPase FtsK/SpoIIIE